MEAASVPSPSAVVPVAVPVLCVLGSAMGCHVHPNISATLSVMISTHMHPDVYTPTQAGLCHGLALLDIILIGLIGL